MKKIWNFIKEHLAISIAVLFLIIVFIYLVIKNRQNAANAATQTGLPGQTGAGEQYYLALLQQEPINVGPINVNIPTNPPTTNPIAGITCPSGTHLCIGCGAAQCLAVCPQCLGPQPTSNTNPLIPFGKYTGPSYSNLKNNTYFTYNNVNYLLSTGSQGRLYGTNPQGQRVLLYAPKSYYQ